MAVARKQEETPLFVTPQEYLVWEAESPTKHEYIAGEILAMSGSTPPHAYISTDLARLLGNRLEEAGNGCEVNNNDLKVRVTNAGPFFYPDVSVTCGEPVIDDDDCLRNPVLIVEVLSPSTALYDRGEKFRYYRQMPSLRHYLLVEQNIQRVEHYARREGGLWALAGEYTEPGASIPLPDLDITLPLAAIYRRATL